MEHNRKELLINRLIMGRLYFKVNHKQYYLIVPSPKILYDANMLYYETLHNNRFEPQQNIESINRLLSRHGLWNEENEKNLKAIENRLDDIKVELFEARLSSKEEKARIKNMLQMVKEKQMEMLLRKHSFDDFTAEGQAALVKELYIVGHCIRPKAKYDGDFIQKVRQIANKHKITFEELRELARSEPWKTYWKCQKNRIFKSIGDDQRNLILFTTMYENASKHPEYPGDEILEDDDVFDGWLVVQRRASEEDKKQSTITKYDKKHPNSNEIFIVAKSQEHANSIYDANSPRGKMIQAQRGAVIKARGEVNESELPDVQEKLSMDLVNLERQARKQ